MGIAANLPYKKKYIYMLVGQAEQIISDIGDTISHNWIFTHHNQNEDANS
jgi:hypothetical protein